MNQFGYFVSSNSLFRNLQLLQTKCIFSPTQISYRNKNNNNWSHKLRNLQVLQIIPPKNKKFRIILVGYQNSNLVFWFRFIFFWNRYFDLDFCPTKTACYRISQDGNYWQTGIWNCISSRAEAEAGALGKAIVRRVLGKADSACAIAQTHITRCNGNATARQPKRKEETDGEAMVVADWPCERALSNVHLSIPTTTTALVVRMRGILLLGWEWHSLLPVVAADDCNAIAAMMLVFSSPVSHLMYYY